jgi:hypothetical protein
VSDRCLVLRVGTDGTFRLPLGRRWWRNGGPAQDALAWALRSQACHRLRCPPAFGLFEAWLPSSARLTRRRDDGWDDVCRLRQHRRGKGQARRHPRRPPSWAEGSGLNGGLKVLVVRDGQQYDATNRLPRPATEVRRRYGVRAHRAKGIRVGKEPWSLSGCQARSDSAQ